MRKEYAKLANRSQIDRLRPYARQVLEGYDLGAYGLRCVNHGFNTTFEVRTSRGSRFALRLNINSNRKPEQLAAEVAWVRALGEDTELDVPHPIANRAGEYVTVVDCPDLGKPIRAVLYSWLSGANVGNRATPEIARALGKATATLHRHGKAFQMPNGAALYGYPDILFGAPVRIPADADHGVFGEAIARANAALDHLRLQPAFPIHFDLHAGNLKWHGGRLSVFDFDDSLLGWPGLDAGVSLFYMRRGATDPALEEAYWEGMATTPEQLGLDRNQLEALIAGRGAFLANELLAMNTADWIPIAQKYVGVTEARLRRYLDTGIFDPSVATI